MKTKCEYFSRSALTPRYTILDSMFPPCNAISEGRLPLRSTGALPSEVRIENDSDRKFSKSIFFSKIFWKPLLSTFYGTLFIISRKYFFPIDIPFWTRGFSLVMRSRKAGFPFATRARKREPCPEISNI